MCAEYTLRASEREISQWLTRPLLNHTPDTAWDRHIRLYGKAPVVLMHQGQSVLEEMSFSMLPPGGHISFTANTRLDDWDDRRGLILAFERPLWREAFLHRRCVVPVSEFLEPIYQGPNEGQMMAFFNKESPLMFIPAIYQETVDLKSGEIFRGFSVLTDFAHPFVRETGHHRTVITLNPESALEWIQEGPIDGRWGIQFLLKHKTSPELGTRAARTMKNWKARVAAAHAKGQREDQILSKVKSARAEWLRKADATRA